MCFSSGCVVGRGSDVGGVQVGAVDAPVRGEVLRCVALDVSLHGDQAAAELQAHGALVGRGAAVSSQVLDHGRVVPRALTTEATLEGLLPGVNSVVCVQLVFQAELFGTVLALVGFVSSVVLLIGRWLTLHHISSSTQPTPCAGLT